MLSNTDSEDARQQLYSRQEYVVGAETQRKYGASDILVVGATGMAAEVVKNLALTGVRSIGILDDAPITVEELGTNFFYTQKDVSDVRSVVMATAAKRLNRFVEVKAVSGSLSDLIPQFHAVVFCNHFTASLIEANRIARAHGVRFVSCESRGVTGCVFVDGGDALTIVDPDGEETVMAIVTSVSPDGLISLHEERKHECEVGSQVYFTGIVSPAQMNSTIPPPTLERRSAAETAAMTKLKLFEVEEVISPYVLRIRDPSSALARAGSSIEVGTAAYMHTTKRATTLCFKSLEASLQAPEFCDIFDKDEKLGAAELMHAVYRAVSDGGRVPSSAGDVQDTLSRARTYCPHLNGDVAIRLLSVFSGDLNPMACFIGGIASQEVLKLCSGKFTPIYQWLYYDVRELLQLRVGDVKGSSSRYGGQTRVLGEEFQRYLHRQRVFIVGAGALGCELIKNVALIGLGGVSITDMDNVEMSNLSRQFLFRDYHIGKAKSTVAGESAMALNPDMQVSSYVLKVGNETEGTFGEDFWARHHAVLNALDNVTSRQYVDERCLFYQRPLFESGTLGTKCNVQCVIPYVTESYSQSYDPPEKSIPLCTLKNFPNAIEHTIQWAQDQFHLLFHNTPDDVNQYLMNFSGFSAAMLRDPAAAAVALRQVNHALLSWPQSEADCVRSARLLYHDYFNDSFQQLLHNIPLGKRNEDGSLFWSGAKKPPTPLVFDPKRPDDAHFIYHTATLLAKVYRIPTPLKISCEEAARLAAAVEVPEFVPKVTTFVTSEKEEKASATPAATSSAGVLDISDLPPVARFANHSMVPETFEKDDITNHHMLFITCCSNLRAAAYGIPPADFATSKRIAGRIIPAMVTTTSLVTGLVCFEMLKYFLYQFQAFQRGLLSAPTPSEDEVQRQLSTFRCGFVNIAIPLIAFSDPIVAPGKVYTLPQSGKSIRWSAWDRIDVNLGSDVSVNALVRHLEEAYELEVSMLSLSSGKMLFMSFGGKAKEKELPVSMNAQLRGEKLLEGCDYLDIIATGTIGDEEAEVPTIRYKFRHF